MEQMYRYVSFLAIGFYTPVYPVLIVLCSPSQLADEQLGPLLKSLGVHDDPLEFFMDLLRLATALQLLSGGALFYGAELCGGLDSGDLQAWVLAWVVPHVCLCGQSLHRLCLLQTAQPHILK